MDFMESFKNLFRGGDEQGTGNKLLRNIILLGMLGTLILLTGNLFTNNSPPDSSERPSLSENNITGNLSYEDRLTRDLEEVVGFIQGVGKVKAQIYFAKGSSYEYEYNQNLVNKITSENDQSGGERQIEEDNQEKEMVIVRDASGNEKPVIAKEDYPYISGILIVAEGAEVSRIKYEIVKAISSLLDLPVHKISVLPYERR